MELWPLLSPVYDWACVCVCVCVCVVIKNSIAQFLIGYYLFINLIYVTINIMPRVVSQFVIKQFRLSRVNLCCNMLRVGSANL